MVSHSIWVASQISGTPPPLSHDLHMSSDGHLSYHSSSLSVYFPSSIYSFPNPTVPILPHAFHFSPFFVSQPLWPSLPLSSSPKSSADPFSITCPGPFTNAAWPVQFLQQLVCSMQHPSFPQGLYKPVTCIFSNQWIHQINSSPDLRLCCWFVTMNTICVAPCNQSISHQMTDVLAIPGWLHRIPETGCN